MGVECLPDLNMSVLCDSLCISFEILPLTVILSFDWLHCYTQCVFAECRWTRRRAEHDQTNDTTLYTDPKWTFMTLDLGRYQSKSIWIGSIRPNLRSPAFSRFRPIFQKGHNSTNTNPNRVGSSQTWLIEVSSLWICWQKVPLMTWGSQLHPRRFANKHCAKRPVCALRAGWSADGVLQQQTVMTKLLGIYMSFYLCVILKRDFIFKLKCDLCEQIWFLGEITKIAR